MTVTFDVKNVGKVAGSEIVQLYLEQPDLPVYSGKYRAPRLLKGFQKLHGVSPGDSRKAVIKLTSKDFSYWNVKTHQWTLVPGTYGIAVGASSRDIRLRSSMTV